MIKVDRLDFSWKVIDNGKDNIEDNIEEIFPKSRIAIEEYLVRHISIAITNKCNLKCKYCYKSVNYDKCIKELPYKIVKQYIDDFSSLDINGNKLQSVQLIGGEPTLHDDFIKICNYIIDKGLQLRISTNGTNTKVLQSDNMLELCRRGNVEFRISLDEIPEKNNKSLRNENAEVVCENIKFLVKNGINVSVKSVITKRNIDDLTSFLGYISSMGVKNFSYSSLYDLGNASEKQFYQENYVTDLEIFKNLIQICNKYPNYASMLQSNVIFHILMEIFLKKPPYHFTKLYTYVNYDGNIYPQDQLNFKEYKIGNIYNYKIDDIVKKLYFYKNKYELRKESCIKCFAYPFCTKGNYGELYIKDKSLRMEFPTCKDLRNLVKYIINNQNESIVFFKNLFG